MTLTTPRSPLGAAVRGSLRDGTISQEEFDAAKAEGLDLVFLAAANRDPNSYNMIVQAANNLTDNRFGAAFRGGDIVARLGGDEFAILLERVADARDTALVAERVQQLYRGIRPA